MAESPPDGAPAAGAPAKAEAAAAGDAAPAPPELTAEERRRQAIAERQRKHDEAALEKQQKAQANSDKRTAAYAKAYNKLCEKGQGTLTASVAENYFEKQAKKEKGNHGVTWQVEDIFRRVNVSNRMDVTLKEFVGLIKAIKKEKRSITRCYNEFEIMDNDSSGEITIREAAEHILQVSSEDGAQIDEETEAQITKYMTKFDKDGDGLMAFPEFWAFTRAQALIKAGVLTDIDDHDKPKDEDLTAAAVVKEPTLPQAPPMSGAKKTMYQNLVDDNGGARREDPKPAPTPVIAARDEANQAHVRTEIKRKRYKSAPPAIREIFDAYAPNTTSRGGGGAGTAASAAVDDDIDAGRLGPQELLELAQAVHFWAGADSHGERPQAEQCAALLAALDADGNGDVSPDEFAAWFMAGAKETELLKNMQDESERIAADPDASAARAAMMDFHDVKKEREEYPSFEKNFRYHLQLQSQEMLLESVHKLHTDALSRSASTEVGQDELLGWMKQVQEATGDQRVPNESDAAAVMKLMAEESGDGLEIIAKDHLVIWAPEVLLHSPMLIPGSEVRQAYLNAADNDTDSGSSGNNDRGTERLRREKVLAFLDGVNLEAGPGTRKRAEELRDMYRAERSQNWQSIGASGDGKVARRQLWEHEREYHENRPSSLHYIYDTFDDSIEAMAERQNNITAGSNIRNTTGFNMKRGHLGGKALFNLANCLYFRAERRREASSGESFLKRRSSTENDSFKHGGKKGNGKLVPTPALATQLISILDKDGNKTIEWAEFKGFLVQGAKMTAADRANLNVQSSARKFSLELLDNVLDENHELMETALRLQYEEFDADISGTMDASELLGWMQEVHLETGARCCEPTPEIAAKVISFLDKDKSGTIEAEEWLEWLREGQLILLDPKRKEQYRRDGGMGAVTILDFLDMVVLRAAKRTRGLLRDIQQDYAEKMAAATKIQAKARGRLQNSEFAEMQAEYQRNSAATKIQSVHRGRQSRRLGGSKGVGAGFGAGTGEPQNEQLIPSARAKLTESEYNKARQEMKDDEPPKTIAPKTIAPKAALPRKPAKKPAPAELLTIEIQEGSIGITFDHDLTVKGIRAGSQANSFKELSRGDFLIKVNDTSVDGQTLRDLKPIIKATPRPMTLVFERHRVWERGPNGLPKIDYGMLYALFEHYEDPDKPGFLDADQFAELISEIHRMAVEHQGRQPHDDIDEVNVPLAQMLIDAHDDNDDQLLSRDELVNWIKNGMEMSLDERIAYGQRPGHFPYAMRFIEDSAHALHLAAGKEEDAGTEGETAPMAPSSPTRVSPAVPEGPVLVAAEFVAGPLGFKLNHEGEIVAIRRDQQAGKIVGLSKGDLLVKINDISCDGMTMKQMVAVLQKVGRPMNLVFEQHQKWPRGENGLPSVDYDRLSSMFEEAMAAGDDGGTKSGLDAEGLKRLMHSAHAIAWKRAGPSRNNTEGRLEGEVADRFAQDLIDAHDDNDDGLLQKDELIDWISRGLGMSVAERAHYASRGNWHRTSVVFLEDIAAAARVQSREVLSFEEDDSARIKLAADQKQMRRERLRAVFDSLDVDGSESVTLDELLQGMLRVKPQLSYEQARNLMEDADKDNSGTLDFEEFSYLCECVQEFGTSKGAKKLGVVVRCESNIDPPKVTVKANTVFVVFSGTEIQHGLIINPSTGEYLGATKGTRGAMITALENGDALMRVNGQDAVLGEPLTSALERELGPNGTRPLIIGFRRSRVWVEGPSGLPVIDYDRLASLFNMMQAASPGVERDMRHATLTVLLREIHRLAAHRIGRPTDEIDYEKFALVIMRARKIPSGGGMSYANFKGWIEEGLKMTAAEREAFMEKSKFNANVGKFLEDVSACCYANDFTVQWRAGLPVLLRHSLVRRFHEFADKVSSIDSSEDGGKITSAGLDAEGLLKMTIWSREVLRGTPFALGPLPTMNIAQCIIDAFDGDGDRTWSLLEFLALVEDVQNFPAQQRRELHAKGRIFGHAVCVVQAICLSVLFENAFTFCPRFGDAGDEVRAQASVKVLAECGFVVDLAHAQLACGGSSGGGGGGGRMTIAGSGTGNMKRAQRRKQNNRSVDEDSNTLSIKMFVGLAGRAKIFPPDLMLFRRDIPFGAGIVSREGPVSDRDQEETKMGEGEREGDRQSRARQDRTLNDPDRVPVFLGENFTSGSVAVGKIRTELAKMYREHKTRRDVLTLIDLRHMLEDLPQSHGESRSSKLARAFRVLSLPDHRPGARDLPRLFGLLDIRGTGQSISEKDFLAFFIDQARMGEVRRKEWAKTSEFHARVVNLASVLVMIAASGYIHIAHPEKMPVASQRNHTTFLNGLRATGPTRSTQRDRNKKRIAVGRAKWREDWESGMEKELDGVSDDIDKAWADWDNTTADSSSILGGGRDARGGGRDGSGGGRGGSRRERINARQGGSHAYNARRQAREKKEFLETVRGSNQRTPKLFRHRAPSPTATPPEDGATRQDGASPLARKRVLRTRKVQPASTSGDQKGGGARGIML